MISTEHLERIIINIQKRIPPSANINSGGCIQFAYYFSLALQKAGINHAWTFYESSGFKYEQLPRYGCNHVTIYIPRIGFVDGEIITPVVETHINKKEYGVINYKNMDLEEIKGIKDGDAWNYWYDRKFNSELESVIEYCFKNV